MTEMKITGGDKLEAFLNDLAKKVSSPGTLQVGFFAGSTYPDSDMTVPMVAAANEFGGTATIPAHDVVIHRNPRARKNKGKFVKASTKNATTEVHHVESYTITRPPRPFFRRMINLGKEHWGKDLAAYLKKRDYDVKDSLEDLAEEMEGELVESITAQVYAPLAASTIRSKGNDQQLIDTANMRNSVTSKVQA